MQMFDNFDWRTTPLGPRAAWSAALCTIYDVMMSAHVAMCAAWGPERTFLYNAAYAPFLGPRHPSALGRPIDEVWPELWPEIAPLIARAMAGERVHFTDKLLVMTRDGVPEDTWWDFSYSALRDGDVTMGFLNVTSEATHHVRSEQRRDATEAGLRLGLDQIDALLSSSSQVRYLLNADWTLLRELTGGGFLASTAVEQAGWLEAYIPPEDRDLVRAEIARVVRTGADYHLEHRVYRKDGRIGWAHSRAVALKDNGGRITGWLGAASDISDRKRSQAALEDENADLGHQVSERTAEMRLYRDIVQADASPILAFDHDHRVTGFNTAHAAVFQSVMNHRQVIGENLPALFSQDQASALRGLMDRALAGERFSVVQAFGDTGREVPTWDITYTPLRDGEGRVIGAFHHARDISERVRVDAELQELQEQLRQSQKMEAVGQLTGGLAHDFNNLLAGISGSLELMNTRINQGRIKDVEKYMVAAQGATRRAAALTHRLLAFSRRQTLAPKPTDTNRLVNGMLDLIQRTVGPDVAVESVGTAGLWTALVDPSQLENALLNLCINARDAMPGGGRITIETANRWIDRAMSRQLDMPEGQYLSLCVSDAGTGMPPEVVAKAFDPFFTTKPLGEGTGLGLSMIYGFAKQSGGQVRIYSEVGEGTMVCLYLPRHPGGAEGEETGPSKVPVPRAEAGETVLVVDDEPTVRMLVSDVLEDLGYTAIEAGDGVAGLKVLQSDVRIDLLVTDVGLPGGLNGRQMADAARVHRPDLKVLFITGYAENALLNHGHLEAGMSVLTKPFAVETLAARMRELIADR